LCSGHCYKLRFVSFAPQKKGGRMSEFKLELYVLNIVLVIYVGDNGV